MSEIDDGGPAFPPAHDPKNHPSGMSLRDYFAGQYISGMASLKFADAEMNAMGDPHVFFARAAYQMADAMLAARKEKP